MATAPEVKPALLFMPDISGFTKFVNETEILHGQHIVQELLEIMIDSNKLSMQVNEVEGDAILFFRPGPKPSVDELLKQVETMFFNFHQHLQLYDHQRICPCGACKSAVNLQLKVIAHYGEVAEYMLKDRKKLFGKDVIVIHRLLKNDVDHHEYLLMTDSVTEGNDLKATPDWFSHHEMMGVYDSGEIKYCYSILTDLKQHVPPPQFPQHQLAAKATVADRLEDVIQADMEDVFAAIFDLDRRAEWGEGIKSIEMLHHDKINRVGTEHRCILKAKNNPVIITDSASLEKNKMELVEMVNNGMGGCRYILERQSPGNTNMIVEILVKNNPFVKFIFGLTMKNKFRKNMLKSISNLKEYCTKPISRPESLVTA